MKKLALALVLLAIVASVIYAFFYWSPSRPKGQMPEIVSLIPAESEWIAYADLEAWRDSAIPAQLHKLLPGVAEGAEYREFVRATGFEYSRDLSQAVLALLPGIKTAEGEEAYQTIAFAEGRFDRNRITRYALRSGSSESVGDVSIILTQPNQPADSKAVESDPLLVAFLSDELVAIAGVPASDPARLKRARDAVLTAAEEGRKGIPLLAEGDRVSRVAGAPFFVIGREGGMRQLRTRLRSMSAKSGQAANAIADLHWLAIAARPEQDQVRISMVGECDSVLKATQLELLLHGLSLLSRGALDGPKSRGQLSPEEAALLDRVLATARITREQNAVEVRLEIPIQLLLGNPGKK